MKYFLALAALTLMLAASRPTQAQTPGSGGPTPGNSTPDPTAVPLDGGTSLLLAGGVAYGLRRLRLRRKAA